MTKLVFHIGTPKTGTSFIQSHMAQNRTTLRDLGFYYPVTVSHLPHVYRTFESHHLLTYALADWEHFNIFPAKEFLQDVKSTFKKYGMHTLLLSAENTFWLPTPVVLTKNVHPDVFWEKKYKYLKTVSSFLNEFDSTIVIYLRRQDRWIESWYNQQVKNGFHVEDIVEFVEDHMPMLDYAKTLSIWSEHFGKENIIVRAYEKQQLPDGILQDFVSVIDGFAVDDIPLKRQPRHNAKLTPDVLAFLNQCNSFDLTPMRKRRLTLTIRNASQQFTSESVFRKQEYLSPAQRLDVLEQTREGNECIAREYLSDSQEKLFLEPWPTLDEPWNPLPEPDIRQIFDLLGKVCQDDKFSLWNEDETTGSKPLAPLYAALGRVAPGLRRRIRELRDRRLWDRNRFIE